MSGSLVTVIPVFTTKLDALEERRVDLAHSNVKPGTLFFVGPAGLDWSFFRERWPKANHQFFAGEFFQSRKAYSGWLLRPGLYDAFSHFDFLMVCQTDALLVKPVDTTTWTFDYVGAPWVPHYRVGWNPVSRRVTSSRFALGRRNIVVGNGGLSVRRTEAFSAFTRRFDVGNMGYANEDAVISYLGPKFGLRIADVATAGETFMETGARAWRPGEETPDVAGFHALAVYNPELEARLLAEASS